jgi:hypothetical protein
VPQVVKTKVGNADLPTDAAERNAYTVPDGDVEQGFDGPIAGSYRLWIPE